MAGEIVEKLELDELKRIYRERVREDFPRSERRPFSSMKRMTKAGKYACYGYYDNGSLLAYACYILTENEMYALLDYFAVVPGLRVRFHAAFPLCGNPEGQRGNVFA